VALRTSSVESRFEALHGAVLTVLVGREEELELLLRRWAKAKSGEGQVVLLSGEPGIGKSRLTAALMERLASEPHTRLRYFCSPQHTDSALYPVIGQMERAAGFVHDDTPQAKLDKLDTVLAQTTTSGQDAALFAEMLSLPNDGRYPALDLTPEQRRQRTLQALLWQMAALSLKNPVLMILEDAHWSDPTSLEVFGRVVDRVPTLRVLLLVTFRPEFTPPWIGQPHVTALTLNRLPKRDTKSARKPIERDLTRCPPSISNGSIRPLIMTSAEGRDERIGSSGRTKEWMKVKRAERSGLTVPRSYNLHIATFVPSPHSCTRFQARDSPARASGTAQALPSRFRSLEIFGRRTRCTRHRISGRHPKIYTLPDSCSAAKSTNDVSAPALLCGRDWRPPLPSERRQSLGSRIVKVEPRPGSHPRSRLLRS
jgi:hypothetical protein